MAGYGATARLVPDLALGGRPTELDRARTGRRVPPGPLTPGSVWPGPDPGAFEELRAIRAPSPKTFFERIGRIRAVWAQTTFYLFSPESWR